MKGLNAIITGAGGGIGREIAKALAKKGVRLILLGGKNTAKLSETEAAVKSVARVRVKSYPADITDGAALNTALNKAVKDFGGVDILINNAGVAYSAPFEETPEDVFDNIVNVNFRAPVNLTRLALPYLRKSKRASIINVTSVVAHNGYPLQSAYTASKHALLGFTKSLAAELYKDGIRVHSVAPGGVWTDMIKIARPDLTGEGMIQPTDVANAVLFLLENRTDAVIDEISLHRSGKQPFLS